MYRSKSFRYDRNYARLNLRRHPDLYQVGRGEQGVLLVEPYKSEILPFWKFRTPEIAKRSAAAITKLFRHYQRKKDFVGMDMARKFLQMGYTRSRRYANHASGKKYGTQGKVLPLVEDEVKARSAIVFHRAWKRVEKNLDYQKLKAEHKARYG